MLLREVLIEEPTGARRYGAGRLFFEFIDEPQTTVVLEPARLDVLRPLPKGAGATTKIEEP